MKKNSILALALSLVFFSCNKEKEVATTPQLNTETSNAVAENFVKAKYDFFESDKTEADFDALFSTKELADAFENTFESEKNLMNETGIKYVSHVSNIKIKSRTTNSDASETLLLEELTVLKTNQISEISHQVISTTIQQQYNFIIKASEGKYIITELHDLDKELLERLKTESETQELSVAEQNELTSMADKLNGITATYNRTKVYTYASTYAVTPNPAYQDFSPGNCSYCGGDCTNFLSQCFLVGGWPQKFGASSSLSSWWYGKSTNPVGYKSGFSGVWVSAQKMGFFLKALTSRATRVKSLSLIQLADAANLVGKTGNAYHSLIVTEKSTTGNIFMSCHTSNRFNAPISTWGLSTSTNYTGILPTAFLWQIKSTF